MEYVIDEVKVSVETFNAIEAGKKVIVHQGGTGAGKTFNILKFLIGYVQGHPNLSASIVSPSFPHLRKGAMRDWQKIMDGTKGLYNPKRHNKTEHLYKYLSNSYIEFFSAENEGKVRGPGRQILYINEVNLFDHETVRQLMVRTDLFTIMDFNPIDEFHWLYDKILPRDDVHFVQSTYLDNPFISEGRRLEIERARESDPEWFNVYGLGNRGKSEGLIYTNWDTEYRDVNNFVYGVDFGFNDETVIAKVGFHDKEFHAKELFYEKYTTNSEFINWIKTNIPDWRQKKFVCDSQNKDRITEMQRAGIKAESCYKMRGAIQWVKSHKIHIDKHSPNALKEIKGYKWQQDKKTELYTDEPVDGHDHWLDAFKYGAISFFTPTTSTKGKAYD